MQKVISYIPKYVDQRIYLGNTEKIKYITSDGMEYDKEEIATSHQRDLDYEEFKNSIEHVIDREEYKDSYYCWWRAKNQQELDFLLHHFESLGVHRYRGKDYSDYRSIKSQPVVGEWFSWYREDGGDYRGTYHLTTLKKVQEEYQDFIKIFEGGYNE